MILTLITSKSVYNNFHHVDIVEGKVITKSFVTRTGEEILIYPFGADVSLRQYIKMDSKLY